MSSSGNSRCMSSECTPPQLKLYQTFIFATPILFTLVLLLLFCLLYLRRRRNAAAVNQIRAQFFARGLFASTHDHGLNKSFRDNLPTITFDEKFSSARGDTQCAVCLGDYQLNDKLLQLPTCGHAFHLECIDEWLASNSTCPICRTSLLQSGKIVPVTASPQVELQLQDQHHQQQRYQPQPQLQQQHQHEQSIAPQARASSFREQEQEHQQQLQEHHVVQIER